MVFDHLFNRFSINKDNIAIELKDNKQMLYLGTMGATQQAMLGNHWIDWFDRFVAELLKADSLMGNLGAPVLKPALDALLTEYNSLKESFLSNNIYLNDNVKISVLK